MRYRDVRALVSGRYASGWKRRGAPHRRRVRCTNFRCCGCAHCARADGDEAAYRDYRDRYRALATSLGFEGHMKWAEAMP